MVSTETVWSVNQIHEEMCYNLTFCCGHAYNFLYEAVHFRVDEKIIDTKTFSNTIVIFCVFSLQKMSVINFMYVVLSVLEGHVANLLITLP